MAELTTLARPYAMAAFDFARETDKLSVWSDMLQFLSAIAADSRMRALISDPRIGHSKLADLVIDIGGGRLSDTGQNFVRVLSKAGRLGLVGEIAGVFEQRRAEVEGRSSIEVTAAFEVNPKFRLTIAEAMKKHLGREVDVAVIIDKSLLGGAVIRAGDVVVDVSIRGRLNELANQIS